MQVRCIIWFLHHFSVSQWFTNLFVCWLSYSQLLWIQLILNHLVHICRLGQRINFLTMLINRFFIFFPRRWALFRKNCLPLLCFVAIFTTSLLLLRNLNQGLEKQLQLAGSHVGCSIIPGGIPCGMFHNPRWDPTWKRRDPTRDTPGIPGGIGGIPPYIFTWAWTWYSSKQIQTRFPCWNWKFIAHSM